MHLVRNEIKEGHRVDKVQHELACARCGELENLLHDAESRHADLGEQIAGLQRFLVKAGQTEGALRAELTKVREEDPRSKEIKGILEYWRTRTGHTKARIPLTGERAKLVRGKLRTYKVAVLMEAIDGAALKPYLRYGRRYVSGQETEVKTKLEHCIGSEDRIEENRRTFLEAQKLAEDNPELLFEVWSQFEALAQGYYTLLINAAVKRETPDDLEVAA